MGTGTIIICAIVAVVLVVVTWFAAIAYRKNIAEAKIGRAEDKAKSIIDDALKSAEEKKREVLLTAKEEALKTKNDIEKEVKAVIEKKKQKPEQRTIAFKKHEIVDYYEIKAQ